MKKYVLYGAAAIGGLAKRAIESMGDAVIGYLDRRAFEINEYNGVPVYAPDQIPSTFCKEDIVTFIAVKNVFEHEKIARRLYRSGLKKIVYKPYNVLIGVGTEEENALADLYDLIYEGNVQSAAMAIPQCFAGSSRPLFDYAKIEQKGDNVVAYIPTEFIFTNNYDEGGMKKWGNIPIAGLFTHINFFRSLGGDISASVDPYVEEYCVYTATLQGNIKITNAWKENVVENRTQIYEQMREAQNIDPDFFVRNAATAVWNEEKKYFNLTSGKHRCSFLAAQGMKYIPLCISLTDYETFANRKYAEQIAEEIYNTEDGCNVPNPFFYRGAFNRDRGAHDFLLWFTQYYAEKMYWEHGKVDFSKLYVYDLQHDYGHMARYLSRIGVKVQRPYVQDYLEEHLNNLFKNNIYYNCSANRNTDIIIADSCDVDKLGEYNIGNTKELILRNVDNEVLKKMDELYGFGNSTLLSRRTKKLKQVGDYLFKQCKE